MLKFYYFMVGFKSRRNYWSCSAFATWCNKTFGTRDKPKAGTLKEFYDYKTSAKTVSPILYWFVETFLDTIQDIIYFPKDVLYHIKYKFANRFISKTHVISTTLPVGDWHDCDSRISSGLFLLIVNFVEKEKAHMHRISMGGPKKTNREDGIAYLDWEIGLGDDGGTDQVASAIEIKEIYSWIKDVYPNRFTPIAPTHMMHLVGLNIRIVGVMKKNATHIICLSRKPMKNKK